METLKNLKNNKKTLILMIACVVFVIAMLIFQFAGSGSSDDETETAASEEEVETVTEPATAAEQLSVSDLAVTQETLAATVDTPCVQVNTTTIYIGTSTVQDLVDAGAEFQSDGEADTIEFSEDPGETRDLEFITGNTTLYVTVQNTLSAIAPLSDSVISDIYWDGSDILGLGGVAIGDSLDLLLERLGEPYAIINSEDYSYAIGDLPDTSRVYLYTDEIDHAVFTVSVDRNTYEINHMEEVTAGVCITDASQVTLEQLQYLVDDFASSNSEIETVYYKTSLDANKTSATVLSLSFDQVQAAVIRDFDDSTEASEFYEVKAEKYLYSSYLFVEYTAALEFSDDSTTTAVGGFIVYDPVVDASGNIVSDTNRAYSDATTAYSSAADLVSAGLESASSYSIAFSEDDYIITTQSFS